MIKKWTSFLEAGQEFNSMNIQEAIGDFIEKIHNFIADSDYGLPRQFYINYSYTAQSNKGDLDPEVDFKKVDSYMAENGWPFDRVKRLNDRWNQICSPSFADECMRRRASECAPLDYYLYKATGGDFDLQGVSWDFYDDEMKKDECTIKFGYGWHLTRYGKLCILQNMNMKEFIEVGGVMSDLLRKFLSRYVRSFSEKKFDEIFFTQDRQMYIDLEEIYRFIKSESSIDISKKDLIVNLTDYFESLTFNVKVIGEDMILKYSEY